MSCAALSYCVFLLEVVGLWVARLELDSVFLLLLLVVGAVLLESLAELLVWEDARDVLVSPSAFSKSLAFGEGTASWVGMVEWSGKWWIADGALEGHLVVERREGWSLSKADLFLYFHYKNDDRSHTLQRHNRACHLPHYIILHGYCHKCSWDEKFQIDARYRKTIKITLYSTQAIEYFLCSIDANCLSMFMGMALMHDQFSIEHLQ